MNTGKSRPAGTRRMFSVGLYWMSFCFLLAGILASSYAAYALVDGQVFQAIALHKFAHRVPLAEPHLQIPGEIVGQLQIPSMELRVAIIHGDSREVLRRGVGHLPDSPLPGQWGNVAIAGHRDTFFRPLRQIRIGDDITIETSSGFYRYRVESTGVVPPGNIEVLRSSNRRELTLITCFPFDYIGPAPSRFIVRAVEVEASPE